MTTPQEGTPAAPEQALPSTPAAPPEQPTPTPQNPEAPAAPQIPADFQAQLDAANARAAELEKQARYHQSRADQEANRVRALAGLTPPAPTDPLAPYLEKYKAYEPEVAKTFAEIEFKNDQRYNQLQSAVQMHSQMGQLMDQAFTIAPTYLADPEVTRRVQNTAAQYAKDGITLTAEHLAEMAAVAHMYVTRERASTNGATPPPIAPVPQFNRGMFGVGNNFAGQPPVPQNQNAIPAHLKALQQETAATVAARFKLPTSQA